MGPHCETTAVSGVDDAVNSGEKPYSVAQFCRAHLSNLEALRAIPEAPAPDAWGALLTELSDADEIQRLGPVGGALGAG
jgi:hypothetical protein